MSRNLSFLLILGLSYYIIDVTCSNLGFLNATTPDPNSSYPGSTVYGPLPAGYDKAIAPWNVTVYCGIYILDLGQFSERLMKYEIEFYLHCDWVDHRLAKANLMEERGYQIVLPYDYQGNRIHSWAPAISFSLAKDVTHDEGFFYGRWDGTITMFRKYQLTSKCHMALGSYPLDVQNCALGMDLWTGGRLVWGPRTEWFDEYKQPVVVKASGINAQFKLVKVHAFSYVHSYIERGISCVYAASSCDFTAMEDDCLSHDCISADKLGTAECEKCNYYGTCTPGGAELTCDETVEHASGISRFTSGQIRFSLIRRFNYHLVQTYGPTLTTVGMSWTSFWVNPEVVPARVSLNVVTVLTMLTQTRKVESFPEVSYVRAIDVWLFACQCFVFLSLIEYGVVHFYIRSEKATSIVKEGRGCCKSLTPREKALRHDYAARVWFPVCFLLFMIGYFAYFVVDWVNYSTGNI